MKINYSLSKFLLLTISTTLIIGCNKENHIDSNNLSGTQKHEQNKILNISKTDFNLLQKKYTETKEVYKGQFGTIKSLSSAVALYDEASNNSLPQEVSYEVALEEVISDPFIGSVINPDGEIIVEDELYRVTIFGTFKTTPNNRAVLNDLMTEIQAEYPLEDIDLDDLDFDLSEYQAAVQNPSLNEDEQLLVNDIIYIPTFANDNITIQNKLIDGDPGLALPIPLENDQGYSPSTYIPSNTSNTSSSTNTNGTLVTEDNWEQHWPTVNTDLNHPMFAAGNMTTGNMVNPEGSFWKTLFKKQSLYNNFNKEYRTSVNFYNRNYGFWKSLGLQVKHQKKGWLFWKKEKTAVIAAGWEGMVYSLPTPNLVDRHFATYIKSSTMYGVKPIDFNPNAMFKLPNEVDLLKFSTSHGDYYAPLVAANGLPLPQNVRNGELDKIIKYLWGLVLKKAKDGETIIKENNKPVYYNALENIKNTKRLAIILKTPESQNNFLFLPPYLEFAYNTDIIDIPLDNYNADIATGANLIIGTILNPQNNYKPLSDWIKAELKQKFVMKQAVVYGSSQKNGLWRGVRVVHN